MLENKIKETIRDVIDFPKQGIIFKDITPILENTQLTAEITDAFVEKSKNLKPDAILGIESRGFFWGILMAQKMGLPFIPVRKKGKLPYKTISYKYDLEYGSAEIEMHEDAVNKGMNVLIHDDLLATGGTAVAAAELVKSQGANVVGFSFLVNLTFLDGNKRLTPYSNKIISLVNY
tara:strand:- start:853 stop:1380 length:528 start_codon:yes stop_codon:yes gene_type:complete